MTAPPDHQLVVRGGLLSVGDLERTAKLHRAQFGSFGWSVYSVPAASPIELLEKVAECFPHTSVAFSNMGKLREHGMSIEQTGQAEHYSVVHPEKEDLDYAVVQFRSAFTVPVLREKAHEIEVF